MQRIGVDRMKVIDLLNKMAHGEEVPEKIKVDNIIYIYENLEHFYYTDNEAREDLLIRGKDYSTNDFLNWNVELIEDKTIDIDNIEELLEIEEYEDRCDFIVSSSRLQKEYSIPSINGVSFLTGVGLEETKEKILKQIGE